MIRAARLRSPTGQVICQASHMTARSAQQEAEWFTSPQQVNQRRYEALRAYFVDRLSYAEAGARFGYTRWAMINLVRDWRAGKLELFAPPGKPGPKTAPAKDRALGAVLFVAGSAQGTWTGSTASSNARARSVCDARSAPVRAM